MTEHSEIMGRLEHIEHQLEILMGGNDTDLQPGVLGIVRRQGDRLSALDTRLSIAERTLDRYRWTVAGFTVAGSVFGGAIVALITGAIA